jgi:hypothetical protein
MAALEAPGVRVEFVDAPADIDPVRVDVPAFVSVCERGPLHTPVRVSSWPAFVTTFGGFIANGLGAYTVKGFFDNGGSVCHVVRVAAPAAATRLSGAQPGDRRSSKLLDVTGFAAGAAATLRQAGAVHVHLVTAVNVALREVTWDRPLHPALNLTGAPVLTVETGAGTASVDLLDAAGTMVATVAAASPGAWGDRLSVRVTAGRRAGTRNRPAVPTSGAATPVESVDGFVAGSLVHLAQEAGGAAVRATRTVTAVDGPGRLLWWDTALGAPFALNAPIELETDTFTLSVRERGALREVHADLSLVPAHPRYAPTATAGSALIAVTAPALAPVTHPAESDWLVPSGGRDGTAALTLADLVGALDALADVREPAAVAIPDLVAEPRPPVIRVPEPQPADPCAPCPPPPAPPDPLVAVVIEAPGSFDEVEVARGQQALVEHCERAADRIALLDPPAAAGPLDLAATRDWRVRFDSSYAAAWTPWLRVVDPRPEVRQGGADALRRIPPSGHVAGLIAHSDAAAGAWAAPANLPLRWCHALDAAITEAEHAILNADGVNVARALPGRGPVVLGARTVSSDTLLVLLNVRRLLLMLERTLRIALQWTVFEPANAALDAAMGTSIGGLLEDLWTLGAFTGDVPEQAWFVHTGLGDRGVGEVIVEVGVAPVHPAEFVLVRVERAEDRLELTERPERSV